MKKTIYVHIGRPKVGSTAIQRFLKTNREALLKQGVLYPRTGERQNASHVLCGVLLSGLASGAESNVQADKLYAQLFAEIESSQADRVIISSENFYFLPPDVLRQRLLPQYAVKIICYLRRQDEVLVSSYLQELRDDTLDKSEAEDLDLYLSNPDRLRLLDYAAMLDAWASAFGSDNIIARVYEAGQMAGSIYEDILSVLDLRLEEGFSVPALRVNPSPSTDVLRLIRLINEFPVSKLLKLQIKSRLVEVSELLPDSEAFDAKLIFSSAQRAKAVAHFDSSNQQTAQRYLGRSNGKLFHESVSHYPDEGSRRDRVNSPYELDRLATMMVGMFVEQQKELNRFRLQLETLEKRLSDALRPGTAGRQ